jgi:hypothetical protein
MPAKSKAMFRKMFVLEREGKISDATRREFTDTVKYADLPEHAGNRHNPLEGTRRRGKKP